jgi:hypothetical protein
VPNDPVTYCEIIEDPLNANGSIHYLQIACPRRSPAWTRKSRGVFGGVT